MRKTLKVVQNRSSGETQELAFEKLVENFESKEVYEEYKKITIQKMAENSEIPENIEYRDQFNEVMKDGNLNKKTVETIQSFIKWEDLAGKLSAAIRCL